MIYICAGCGEDFENAAEQAEHAATCPELDGNQ